MTIIILLFKLFRIWPEPPLCAGSSTLRTSPIIFDDCLTLSKYPRLIGYCPCFSSGIHPYSAKEGKCFCQ